MYFSPDFSPREKSYFLRRKMKTFRRKTGEKKILFLLVINGLYCLIYSTLKIHLLFTGEKEKNFERGVSS